NRGMGLICIWSTAFLLRYVLATRIKLREQDWLRTARTRIADAIVGEQSLARLSERVLQFLTNYLGAQAGVMYAADAHGAYVRTRSEEHTSELQSRGHLVCRLLLEKKKKHIPPALPNAQNHK